jgi:16S rRNA (uracil1498-N3)-methyltransferase
MKALQGRISRLFVDVELRSHASLELPEAIAHHAARVLRLAAGDRVHAVRWPRREYEALLAMPGRGRVVAEIGEHRQVERESPLDVTLVAGRLLRRSHGLHHPEGRRARGRRHPSGVQLKVHRAPFGRAEAKKLAHWRRVAIAACEQCGRNRVPEVAEPVTLDRYRAPDGSKILLAPSAPRRLVELAQGPVILAAGPEGGFSEEEEAQLQRAGFVAAATRAAHAAHRDRGARCARRPERIGWRFLVT